MKEKPVKVKKPKMVTAKTWNEFRDTGLLLIINQFLHVFGWAIVFDFDNYNKENDTGEIKKVYPARVRFRGFEEKSTEKNYIKVSEYMHSASNELLEEAKS